MIRDQVAIAEEEVRKRCEDIFKQLEKKGPVPRKPVFEQNEVLIGQLFNEVEEEVRQEDPAIFTEAKIQRKRGVKSPRTGKEYVFITKEYLQEQYKETIGKRFPAGVWWPAGKLTGPHSLYIFLSEEGAHRIEKIRESMFPAMHTFGQPLSQNRDGGGKTRRRRRGTKYFKLKTKGTKRFKRKTLRKK